MNDLLVIPKVGETPEISLTPTAIEIKRDLLQRGLTVDVIPNEKQRDRAIAIAAQIRAQIKLVEVARTEAKSPFAEVANSIDRLARVYRTELAIELDRINILVGEFENKREKAHKDEEETIEQERLRLAQEAVAELPVDATPLQRGAALERAMEAEEGIDAATGKIATLRASGAASKATGGMLRRDWDIDITDIHALLRAHPQCVELAPRLLAIKDLLRAGITPAGVKATPKATFATRAAKTIRRLTT